MLVPPRQRTRPRRLLRRRTRCGSPPAAHGNAWLLTTACARRTCGAGGASRVSGSHRVGRAERARGRAWRRPERPEAAPRRPAVGRGWGGTRGHQQTPTAPRATRAQRCAHLRAGAALHRGFAAACRAGRQRRRAARASAPSACRASLCTAGPARAAETVRRGLLGRARERAARGEVSRRRRAGRAHVARAAPRRRPAAHGPCCPRCTSPGSPRARSARTGRADRGSVRAANPVCPLRGR